MSHFDDDDAPHDGGDVGYDNGGQHEHSREAPPKDCQLLVSQLPLNVTDDEFKQAFERIAPVFKATIVREKSTGVSKGFGFLDMKNLDGVCDVLDAGRVQFHDHATNANVYVRVATATAKNQLYVAGMPTREMDEATLVDRIGALAGESIIEHSIYRDVNGKTFGYGWFTFEDHATALRALRQLGGKEMGGPKPLVVSIAARPRIDPHELRKVKSLFMRAVPSGVTAADIKDLFGGEGAIVSCNVPTDHVTKKPLNHAFVNFASREAAQEAMTKLHGREWRGGKISLEWCLPESAKRERVAAATHQPFRPSAYGHVAPAYSSHDRRGAHRARDSAPLMSIPPTLGAPRGGGAVDAHSLAAQYEAYASAAAAYAQYAQYLAQVGNMQHALSAAPPLPAHSRPDYRRRDAPLPPPPPPSSSSSSSSSSWSSTRRYKPY